MQYENHSKTGDKLISEKQIKNGLKYKSIKEWAYICHDKDKEEDGITLKPKHWHIVLRFDVAVDVKTIAKWFSIEENYIEMPKGRGAFLDCVEYLTHESGKQRAQNKHVYEDSEVKSNFDFRERLQGRHADKSLYDGKALSPTKRMKLDVLCDGKTLQKCKEENPLLFTECSTKLKELRLEYLKTLDQPSTIVNYYITGSGGVGKGLMSRAIARNLYPELQRDEDIFFTTGGDNVLFEGYDGQPVIIWNDYRSRKLLKKLGGREGVFNVFDTHPSNQGCQHIKYGSIKLCNAVNIINGQESYEDFLNDLAGFEDKTQSYRRFQIILELHEDDYDLLLNKGYMEDSYDFFEYFKTSDIKGNMRKIVKDCGVDSELAREMEAKAIRLILEKHNAILDKNKTQSIDRDEIRKKYESLGYQKHNNLRLI